MKRYLPVSSFLIPLGVILAACCNDRGVRVPSEASYRELIVEERARGVYTASSGNMAQEVAWAAAYFGVPVTVLRARRSIGCET
jgi:hypothetical protein